MSIGKFQEKFLGKGCATVIALVCSFVFLFFGFSQCSRFSGMNGTNNGQEDQASVAVKVGDVPITTTQIQDAQSRINSQMGMGVPLSQQARASSEAVYALVSQAANTYLAEKNHIPMTDDAILAAVQSQVQEDINQKQMQLMIQGKVKDPKDMDAAFKEAYRVTPQDAIKNNLTQAREALGDKDKRQMLVNQVASDLVQNYYASKVAITDQDLRASFDSYVTKRIFVVGQGKTNPDEKISQAAAALKSGMSFEQAMDKFSDDPAIGKGKKVSDNTNTVPASIIPTSPEYKDLVGQKPGYVSQPESVNGGKAIYKLISIKSDLPKDFQTNQAKYKADFAKTRSTATLKKDVDALLNGPDVTWTNQGDKALFDFFDQSFANPDPANMNTAMRKIADQAKAATQDPASAEAAAFAWYLAFDTLYNAQGADKTKLRDERIDVLNALLLHTEDFEARLELVDLYSQKKDANDAITNLIATARANTDYSGIGTRQFGDIMAKRAALVKSGLVTDAELKDLDAAQDQWRKDKAAADKDAADTKKQEDLQKAQDAENERKNAAEVARQKAEAEKNAPKTPSAPSKSAPRTGTSQGDILPPGTVGPSTGGSLLPPGTVPSRGPGG